eukprot:408482-Rhodomonas_salina.2
MAKDGNVIGHDMKSSWCRQENGGRFEQYFDSKVVTHIIAETLAETHIVRQGSISTHALDRSHSFHLFSLSIGRTGYLGR